MSRQTSDRLVPISSAIFVPLATTVAWLMSRRTMRPRRTSVALCTDGKLRVFVEAAMEGIITSRVVRCSLFADCLRQPSPSEDAAFLRTANDEQPTTSYQRPNPKPE